MVREAAFHLLKPFAQQGFGRLLISSFHSSPRHICALEEAADLIANEFGQPTGSLFSMAIARVDEQDFLMQGIKNTRGCKITHQQLLSDFHAGFIETSLAVHLYPKLVKQIWNTLEPLTEKRTDKATSSPVREDDCCTSGKAPLWQGVLSSVAEIAELARKLDYYRSFNYHGYPALASAEAGRDLLEHLSQTCAQLVVEFIHQGNKMDCHSPLWKYRKLLNSSVLERLMMKFFKWPLPKKD